jgi:hypothetical protein
MNRRLATPAAPLLQDQVLLNVTYVDLIWQLGPIRFTIMRVPKTRLPGVITT